MVQKHSIFIYTYMYFNARGYGMTDKMAVYTCIKCHDFSCLIQLRHDQVFLAIPDPKIVMPQNIYMQAITPTQLLLSTGYQCPVIFCNNFCRSQVNILCFGSA